jgi:hypothetical protein
MFLKFFLSLFVILTVQHYWVSVLYLSCCLQQLGNERYKNGEYGAAIGQYHRAIIYLKAIDAAQKSPLDMVASVPVSLPPDKRQEVDQLFADCQSNLAGQ